ncbi:hypothetical protein, partial [Mycobacterium sp.]
GEQDVLEEVLRFCRIDIPDRDEPLTYDRVEGLLRERGIVEFARYKQLLDLGVHNIDSNRALSVGHEPGVFDGDITIFSAAGDEGDQSLPPLQSWRPYVTGDINSYPVDCGHQEMMSPESLVLYGEQLKVLLEREGARTE